MEKLTEEELDDILMIFNSDTVVEDIKKYIDDPELLEEYNKCIEIGDQDPDFDFTEMENKIYTYLIRRVRTENIPMLANNFEMLYIFMEHPELVTDEPIPMEVTEDLIYNVMDMNSLEAKNLIDEISQNKEKWGLTDEQVEEFKENITYQIQSNSQSDHTKTFDDDVTYESKEDREASELRQKLGITEDEIFSIKVYEGVRPYREGRNSTFSSSSSSYDTINAMLFPGIMNEAVRCCEDNKYLDPQALEEADEMLRIVTEMYSVMCKYGKNLEETQFVDRLDRSMSYDSMQMTGTTNSFASCSFGGIQGAFKKAHVTIFHMEVEPGAKCADFRKILGPSNYLFAGESELLIAPYEQIEMEEIDRADWTSDERSVTDLHGGPADRSVRAKVKAGERPKPLTPEEKIKQEEAMAVFSNPDLRKRASEAIAILNGSRGMDPHEAVSAMPVDTVNAYLEWKNAYHTVLKFRMREIELQVDKQFEDKQASQPQIEQEPEQEEQHLQHEIDEAYMKLYETLYGKSLTSPVKKATTKKVMEDIQKSQEKEGPENDEQTQDNEENLER